MKNSKRSSQNPNWTHTTTHHSTKNRGQVGVSKWRQVRVLEKEDMLQGQRQVACNGFG